MPGDAFRSVFSDIIAEAPGQVDRDARRDTVAGSKIAVVVEDDADIRGLISEVLEQAGFTIHAAGTGADGIELVKQHDPLVTTLDISMPGMDGFETAKRIRAVSPTYIIMLSARADEIDTLQGLQAGADDYITKPFRPRELRARVEAMLRRPRVGMPEPSDETPAGGSSPAASAGADDGWLIHRGLRVHPAMRIAEADGTELDLTRSEFDILADLMGAGRRVVSKSDLALMLRGERYVGGSDFVSDHDVRAIEVHVANLRRKLGESATQPRWIETIRGVGYRMTAAA
jgi:DNA-binding response OmpR family regulator